VLEIRIDPRPVDWSYQRRAQASMVEKRVPERARARQKFASQGLPVVRMGAHEHFVVCLAKPDLDRKVGFASPRTYARSFRPRAGKAKPLNEAGPAGEKSTSVLVVVWRGCHVQSVTKSSVAPAYGIGKQQIGRAAQKERGLMCYGLRPSYPVSRAPLCRTVAFHG